jgi:tetratricopeptide (TPR) repeat protein
MVRDNLALRAGLSAEGVRWAFGSVHGANWIPLTWLSYLADHEISGLAPGGVHATNVVLHALSALLLFAAFVRMTGAPVPSFFVAGVFALHPIQVETVAWASERKGLLSGVFWMLAVLVHASGGPGPRTRARIAALAAIQALGLLAKGMLVTLPFALLLLDLWPLRRLGRDGRAIDPAALRGAVLEKVPLFLVSALSAVATFFAQRAGGAVAGTGVLPIGERLANVPVAYLRYVGKIFWPSGFAPFYPHPEVTSLAVALGAAAVLAAVVALALASLARRPHLAVGWLWFLGVLVPMIGVVQVGSQALADRYAYVPIVGIAAALAFEAAERARGRTVPARALAVAAVCIPLALGALAARQTALWRDPRLLFDHALRVTGQGNWLAHEQLGAAWLEAGRPDVAIGELEAALRLRPYSDALLNNIAWTLATSPDATVRKPERAIELVQRSIATYGATPATLDTLAAAYASAGRFAEAVTTQLEAVRQLEAAGAPDSADYRRRLETYRAGRPWIAPYVAPTQ